MSRPAISIINLNPHLSLSECHPDSECRTNSWWLYDSRVGWNIGMREKTRDEAFVEAIEYWAKRAIKSEAEHSKLQAHVSAFVTQVSDPEDQDEE